jgi:hypothetical protein
MLLCFVFVLCLVFPMLPVSLECPFLIAPLVGVNSGAMCSGRVGSSCFTSVSRRVNLVTNPVISHEWGKDRG